MIYSGEKSSDQTAPLAILLTIGGVLAAPFAAGVRSAAGRIWVPQTQ
ncbi:hypothetical protein EV128_12487 [Rhizobium azibense]|nr:hypothetical protein EV128_12487 [Rhizobium azibense]